MSTAIKKTLITKSRSKNIKVLISLQERFQEKFILIRRILCHKHARIRMYVCPSVCCVGPQNSLHEKNYVVYVVTCISGSKSDWRKPKWRQGYRAIHDTKRLSRSQRSRLNSSVSTRGKSRRSNGTLATKCHSTRPPPIRCGLYTSSLRWAGQGFRSTTTPVVVETFLMLFCKY